MPNNNNNQYRRRNINPDIAGPDYLQFLELYHQIEEELYDENEEELAYYEAAQDETEEEEDETEEDDETEEESEEEVVIIEPPGAESEEEVVMIEPTTTTRVSSQTNEASTSQQQPDGRNKRKRTSEEEEEVETTLYLKVEEGCKAEWNRGDMEGLFCPICMEAWTGQGDHQVCCLPCGHLYGMSCIKKWLRQRKTQAKCPQCNMKCTLKDIRKHYESRVVVVDEESKKRVQYLERKCAEFSKKESEWHKKEYDWQKKEAELQRQLAELRAMYFERPKGDRTGVLSASGDCADQATPGWHLRYKFAGQRSCSFMLKKEFQVDGARMFDIDASSQIAVVARRLSVMDGVHVLTKVSLLSPHDREDIMLPSSTKAVKDLHFCSVDYQHVLYASLGKKLAVVSMESNNVVLSYDLPAPAWSCSWDANSSLYAYAGLQNGMLMVFDMRQTSGPLQSMGGLTCNPIHTIHSLSQNSSLPLGSRSILTASSVGISQWNLGPVDERPSLIIETENQGVCISLAHSPKTDDFVASFRPKIEMPGEIAFSQNLLTPSPAIGQGTQGCHLHYKRVGGCYRKMGSSFANVDNIRLPKSVIVDIENQSPLFMSSDEATNDLVLQYLPNFTVVQRIRSQKHPIRDMKYTYATNPGLLSCLCDDTLQLFRPKIS